MAEQALATLRQLSRDAGEARLIGLPPPVSLRCSVDCQRGEEQRETGRGEDRRSISTDTCGGVCAALEERAWGTWCRRLGSVRHKDAWPANKGLSRPLWQRTTRRTSASSSMCFCAWRTRRQAKPAKARAVANQKHTHESDMLGRSLRALLFQLRSRRGPQGAARQPSSKASSSSQRTLKASRHAAERSAAVSGATSAPLRIKNTSTHENA